MIDPGRGPAALRPGRRILVLVGSVGAGKGTQAAVLSRELGLVHLASGNLFRQALRDGSTVGERARTYMERGDLVPDEITIEMFMHELSRPAAARGAILDGFPRTVTQAEALDATLAGLYVVPSRWTKLGSMPCDWPAKAGGPYIPGDLFSNASIVNGLRWE